MDRNHAEAGTTGSATKSKHKWTWREAGEAKNERGVFYHGNEAGTLLTQGCHTRLLRLGSGALSSPYAIQRGGCDE